MGSVHASLHIVVASFSTVARGLNGHADKGVDWALPSATARPPQHAVDRATTLSLLARTLAVLCRRLQPTFPLPRCERATATCGQGFGPPANS